MAHIWIIDDDDSLRWVLDKAFTQAGYVTQCFEDANQALTLLADVTKQINTPPDIILSDIRMPGLNGLDFLQRVHKIDATIPVIVMTAHSDLDAAVSSYKLGAFEYLPKPFDLDDAIQLVQRAINNLNIDVSPNHQPPEQANEANTNNEVAEDQFESKTIIKPPKPNKAKKNEIIGESPAMQEVFRAIGRLAKSNITVLINGESGTGKELIAQALHAHSPRNNKPYIALNMAAIPADLIEAELFGHEKGAFTGANALRKGRFEQANGGTLFLDEIGDMPYATQTRLLRVLADGEFYRVGGHTPINVDVRIIAATHQNLEERVAAGKFREDLFYRLNVIRLHLPALRERPEDIPMLAQFFLKKSAETLNVEPKILNQSALNILQQFDWRGNVRQLENTCRWLTVMAATNHIDAHDLPEDILKGVKHKPVEPITETSNPTQKASNDIQTTVTQHADITWQQMLANFISHEVNAGNQNILSTIMPEFERTLIQTALTHTKGRKGEAAELLGWGRNTLTRKLQELDMNKTNMFK